MAEPIAIDSTAFKLTTRKQWDDAAEGWNDNAPHIRAWLRDATEAMLEMAGITSGQRVLDVAAGAGDQTLDVAERVGPSGSVLATDLSPGILAIAQRNVKRAGYDNVAVQVADGEHLDLAEASFDAAVCRLGLMFFLNPLQGLHQIGRALKPDGGICTMVFSTPETNPCIAMLMSTALKHAGLPARDPYQPGGLLSLGKPRLIDQLFRDAGFREVATTKMAAPFKLASAQDYLNFIQTSAGPILQILSRLSAAAQAAAWVEMKERLKTFDTATGWEGPNELLLTAGRR